MSFTSRLSFTGPVYLLQDTEALVTPVVADADPGSFVISFQLKASSTAGSLDAGFEPDSMGTYVLVRGRQTMNCLIDGSTSMVCPLCFEAVVW